MPFWLYDLRVEHVNPSTHENLLPQKNMQVTMQRNRRLTTPTTTAITTRVTTVPLEVGVAIPDGGGVSEVSFISGVSRYCTAL